MVSVDGLIYALLTAAPSAGSGRNAETPPS